ncbi:unnamed protein product [Parascedosporium putredinis]|uniref:Heterokaryon incompatibility domain-containing protein n=1 Tax=Parascedosporium putredinis TaxID=1442378 RepID=A0A9P1GY99_9PEZI|nr:unnamed protein product [Parascedosporium putredinis]CAI7989737.1 unnamed protein product [Parascedosporium putredinis]
MTRQLQPGIYAPTQVFYHESTQDLDISTIEKHAVRLARAGISGIVTNGSNGEAVYLTTQERLQVTRITRNALDIAGFANVSLLVGTSNESVIGTLELCQDAAEAGRCSIAVSGIDIDSDTLIKLAEHPNIVGTKFTCGNVGKLARVASATKSVSELFTRRDAESISPYFSFAGIADFISPSVGVGASGAIVGAANVFPRACVNVYNLAAAAITAWINAGNGSASNMTPLSDIDEICKLCHQFTSDLITFGFKAQQAYPDRWVKQPNGFYSDWNDAFHHYDTYAQLLESRVDLLPQNFQDAIILTRELGLRYLWIDALCIIQDSEDDWKNEAIKMAEIYSSAVVTISTLNSDRSTTGFLRPRESGAALVSPDFAVQPYHGSLLDALEASTLNTRGWCMQERLLSPALLHIGDAQLFWECRTGYGAESGSFDINHDRVGASLNYTTREFIRLRKRFVPHAWQGWQTWYDLVSEYTLRNLSFASDKFPALAGAARIFQHGATFREDGDDDKRAQHTLRAEFSSRFSLKEVIL